MKTVAIISDIHANLAALEVLLTDLTKTAPDRVICLGDVAATGPKPREVIARLQELPWEFVRGNCDDAILRYAAGAEPPIGDEHDLIDQWCAGELSPGDLQFVSTFQPVISFVEEGVAFCCYHGSPRSNLDELLPGTDVDEIERWLRGFPATVYAGGHTHIQMIRRFRGGYLINPGSVGFPFSLEETGERNPLWVEYALVRLDGEELAIELRRIPYSAAAIAAAVATSSMPHAGWWSADWR